MEIWRHVKTDSLYLVLGEATCSTNGVWDAGKPAVVYYSLTYQRWFYRRAEEFYDGRFVKVEAPEWKPKDEPKFVRSSCVCSICDFDYEYCTCLVDCPKCDGMGSYQWCHGGETLTCTQCGGTGRYEK